MTNQELAEKIEVLRVRLITAFVRARKARKFGPRADLSLCEQEALRGLMAGAKDAAALVATLREAACKSPT